MPESGPSPVCSECNKRPTHARGLCRSCYDRWLKERNPEYAARQRANAAKWHSDHPEELRQIAARYRGKQGSRAHRKYGLAREEYERLMGQPCGICGEPSKHMDHDHSTGQVRGGLCHRCNLGVGYLEGWFAEHERAALAWVRRTNSRFEPTTKKESTPA